MAVARVAGQEPLDEVPFQVTRRALVLGGGLAGMTAALTIADAGFPVYLVEKDGELGGMARQTALHPGRPRDAALPGRPHGTRWNHHPGIQVMTAPGYWISPAMWANSAAPWKVPGPPGDRLRRRGHRHRRRRNTAPPSISTASIPGC